MQQFTSLLLDLFPRDRLYLAGLNLIKAARDLLLPGGVNVLIDSLSRLDSRFPARSARSFSGNASAFCSRSRASCVIFKIILTPANWLVWRRVFDPA